MAKRIVINTSQAFNLSKRPAGGGGFRLAWEAIESADKKGVSLHEGETIRLSFKEERPGKSPRRKLKSFKVIVADIHDCNCCSCSPQFIVEILPAGWVTKL